MPTDKIRVVLDTNVILNALIVKSGRASTPNDEEKACVLILERWKAGEITVGLNTSLKDEYERKLEEWAKKGNITRKDVTDIKAMIQNARYVRSLVDKPEAFKKANQKDDILFDGLSASYLVTTDNGVKPEKMKINPPYGEIIKPSKFVAEFNF